MNVKTGITIVIRFRNIVPIAWLATNVNVPMVLNQYQLRKIRFPTHQQLIWIRYAFRNVHRAVYAVDVLNQTNVNAILAMLEPIAQYNVYAMGIQTAKDHLNWMFVLNVKIIRLEINVKSVHRCLLAMPEIMVNVSHALIIAMVIRICVLNEIQIQRYEI